MKVSPLAGKPADPSLLVDVLKVGGRAVTAGQDRTKGETISGRVLTAEAEMEKLQHESFS